MTEQVMPRYPIYVPSKGRANACLTAKFLIRDSVPFYLVVEPQEKNAYASFFGEEQLLMLPFSDMGSVIPARNWIKEHSVKAGHLRHWQMDDNMDEVRRRFRGKRIPVRAGAALAAVEDFVDRYENIAVAGLNYRMFLPDNMKFSPFFLNVHVYSCALILNSLPYKWRGRYNEDADYCLQVLSGGWCTVLFNAFCIKKRTTMTMKGGNTDELYHGDGRLKMARSLERLWPGVVTTKRRFRRPQHVVKNQWRKFGTPLRLKPDVRLEDFEPVDEHGMKLIQVQPVKSKELRELMQDRLERDAR